MFLKPIEINNHLFITISFLLLKFFPKTCVRTWYRVGLHCRLYAVLHSWFFSIVASDLCSCHICGTSNLEGIWRHLQNVDFQTPSVTCTTCMTNRVLYRKQSCNGYVHIVDNISIFSCSFALCKSMIIQSFQ